MVKQLNMVIDVQVPRHDDTRGLSQLEHEKYVAALNSRVTALREQGVSTLWVAMGDSSELHSPPHSPELIERLRLTGNNIATDEYIFEKRGINGFTHKVDAVSQPDLSIYMDAQRMDGSKYIDGHFGDVTLHDHLQNQKIGHVSIMGGMAGFCITQNALAASLRGYQTTIYPDLVVGWTNQKFEKAVWRESAPHQTEAEIKTAMTGIWMSPSDYGYDVNDGSKLIAAQRKIEFRHSGDDAPSSARPANVLQGAISTAVLRK